jgi:hypothetical protein
LGVEGREKCAEFDRTMTTPDLSQHVAGFHFQGRKERRGPCRL